ncbi:MAG: MFS transporter [Pseudomonadales bacterium]|jgi:GPH family glycoside/pentoside/hexuronide:cation symporter|nr:MFS transporter [Pseudomonadales bacterium]
MKLKASLGYAVGDLGINLYFISTLTYLLYFYTDVLGISAAAAAGVFLVARMVDAVTDPLMGAIAERTRTRWGRLRPYLLWGALPLGAITVATFSVPDLDESGKVIWAYVTYTLFGILYTVVTIPYSALTASLTDDYQERTRLSTFRMAFAFSGALIVSVGVAQWVRMFANPAEGYVLIMSIFACVATLLLLITFFNTKEVVQPPPEQKLSLNDSLRAVFYNPPLLIVIALFTLGMLSFTVRQTVTIYYFSYNVGRPDLIGAFFAATLATMFVGLVFVPRLAERFSKAGAIQIGALFTVLASIGFYLTPVSEPVWVIFWGCLVALGGAPIAVLGWAMIPDTVDYAQWRFGKRADGAVYSMSSFFQKLAKALGGAGVATALATVGYVANQPQSAETLDMILHLMTVVPIGLMVLMIFLARLYKLDGETHARMRADLAQRYESEPEAP